MWVLWILIGVPMILFLVLFIMAYIQTHKGRPREENLGNINKTKNIMLGSNAKSKNDGGLI